MEGQEPDILMVSLERIFHDNGHRNIEKLEEGLRQMNFRGNVPKAAKLIDVFADYNTDRYNHFKELICRNCYEAGHPVQITIISIIILEITNCIFFLGIFLSNRQR